MEERIARLKNVKDKNVTARGDLIYLLTKEVIERKKEQRRETKNEQRVH